MKILDQLAAILIVPIVACDLYYRSFKAVINSLGTFIRLGWECMSTVEDSR